jgi:hypothetical protein
MNITDEQALSLLTKYAIAPVKIKDMLIDTKTTRARQFVSYRATRTKCYEYHGVVFNNRKYFFSSKEMAATIANAINN